MDEKERWEMKFDRLLNRIEKLCEGLVESSLSAKDKAEIWECLWSFLGGMSADLVERCPELKSGP